MHFWHKLNPVDARKAIEYFGEAIAIETNYAQAHIARACLYLFYELKWKIAYAELQTALRTLYFHSMRSSQLLKRVS